MKCYQYWSFNIKTVVHWSMYFLYKSNAKCSSITLSSFILYLLCNVRSQISRILIFWKSIAILYRNKGALLVWTVDLLEINPSMYLKSMNIDHSLIGAIHISHYKLSHLTILMLYSVSHVDLRNSEDNKLTKFWHCCVSRECLTNDTSQALNKSCKLIDFKRPKVLKL